MGDEGGDLAGTAAAPVAARFARPGLYLLDVVRRAGAGLFPAARLTVRGEPVVVTLPLPPQALFLVRVRHEGAVLEFHAADVERLMLAPAGLANAARLLRWRRKDLRLAGDIAEGMRVMPLFWSAGGESRALAAGLRLLDRWGFGLGTRSFQETPGLFEPLREAAPPRISGKPRFGIVLHLYYPGLWPEIRARLAAIREPFDLVVTTPPENAGLGAEVAVDFPGAEVRIMANRGRDLGPFVELLGEGRFDDWPLILKLHGKRSGTSGPRALLGDFWRKASFEDLAGSAGQVEAILARFDAAPRLGMIGSPRFRMPGGPVHMRQPFGRNRDAVLALAARIGIAPADFMLDFHAGTMFWVRPRMLAPLRDLGLRLTDFPEGAGPEDGALHHAVERLPGALAACQDMTVEDAVPHYRRRTWPAG